MKARNRKLCISIAAVWSVFLLQIFASSGLAKASFAKITVSGGELTSEIEITDPALLGFGSLMAIPRAVDPAPPVTGEGYLITRYEQASNGKYVAWDSLRYYPGTADGRGYVYYIGLIDGSSEYDGHWFYADPGDEIVFQGIVNTQTAPASNATKPLLLLGLGLGLIAVIAVLRYIRPGTRQPPEKRPT